MAGMRTVIVQPSRSFLRFKSSFPRRPGPRQIKSQEKDETKGKQPPRPITELLQALKSPIQKSRKAISDLERVLDDHQEAREKADRKFQTKLADHNRKEPQLKWYYDRLGLKEEKR